ncbi:MAG: hypothetical protein K2V38_20235 [Gemmataceae bacterium]|nr:hypothetical protein [Gemmataceae bacterium]
MKRAIVSFLCVLCFAALACGLSAGSAPTPSRAGKEQLPPQQRAGKEQLPPQQQRQAPTKGTGQEQL